MIIYYGLAWLPMVAIAVLNGVVREYAYAKYLSELRAHQVSTLSGLFFFGVYMFLVTRAWPFESASQAVWTGLMWLVLTVGFEFAFGHYVMKHSWEELFHDYNILAGRLWILVLLWISTAPYLFHLLRTCQRS
ncbi:hypothetical protein [Desulfoferrobacter suflitae]|uniref:hypothetical protein n=1 Tax=Desulfoferrobacter suflitae TaxID=2865782 RepID=UPI0021647DFE|nr:hypothetical protein [Desulfoferrobacter suflitae]MCK8601367.1 hypothetical protein [Desulfoferrobacter suflitae]